MPGTARSKDHQPLIEHAFVRTVIDDHSRVAYAEIHDDETALTAAGVLRRAVFWFAACGVLVQQVPTDNGSCYRSHPRGQQCQDLDITHTSGPGPTGSAPTAAISSASTASGQPAGPSVGPTPASRSDAGLYQPGCTSATITGSTPRSARPRP